MDKKILVAEKKVLAKPLGTQVTESGLFIPKGQSESKPQIALVVRVGQGKVPVKMKPGDKVIYSRWGGSEVEVGSEKYITIRFEDIDLVIEQ